MQALDLASVLYEMLGLLVALGLGVSIGRARERETTLDTIDIIDRMRDDDRF